MIKAILSKNFIKTKEVANILDLAITGKKNVILFGPGGHGKSEMIQNVIEGLGLEEETFIQFFGEGMDEARLFGGLDFLKLDVDRVLEYHPERSFLNYKIVIFEEVFDAPANVLLALKDVLTSRELRNGAQHFPMKTEIIICLTNREPSEISEMGAAAHALIERFPLQLNVQWDSYKKEDYLNLLEKIAPRIGGVVLNGFKPILAELLANATANGNFVSPRTAVHAYQIVQAAATIAGRNEVAKEDLTNLRFLPGLESLAKTIIKDIDAALERRQAEKFISEMDQKINQLKITIKEEERPVKLLQTSKKASTFLDEVSQFRVPDCLTKKRDEIRNTLNSIVTNSQSKALECTY